MKQVFIVLFILVAQIAAGQHSYYKVYTKIDSSGLLRSRIVTLDSIEVDQLRTGKLFFRLSKNNNVLINRELQRGDLLELGSLAEGNAEYYLEEFYDILTDPEQPATVDEAYQILTFLSHFNFEAAKWLGLGTEEKVSAGNYKIDYLLALNGKKPTVIASAMVNSTDWQKAPPLPMAPKVTCGNMKADIELFAKNCNFYYWGFNAQRSISGTDQWHFIRPSVNINTYYEEKYRDGRFYYKLKDSLPENNILYEYRMVGMDYFGEYGPPGDVTACMGYVALPAIAIPEINSMVNDSTAEVNWSIRDEALPYVSSVDLMIGIDSLHGNYIVFKENLDFANKRIEVLIPGTQAHFRFRTNPKAGPPLYSAPFDLQRWDTDPPVAPVGLEGKVDTTGVVRLKWKANKEKDLWGYRIFFANNKTDEFSLNDVEIQLTPEFNDTINLNNLSPEIYYKIVALDLRGNISPFSEILTVEKPDTIPPAPALIQLVKQYKSTSNLLIRAVGSSSRDISYHQLFRKELQQNEFQPVSIMGKMISDTVMVDTSVQFDRQYEYRILAVDRHGNQRWSEVSEAEVIYFGARPSLKNIAAVRDTGVRKVVIEWKDPGLPDTELELYRANERGQYTLYHTLPVSALRHTDDTYDRERNPGYRGRIVYPDGTYSNLFEIIVQIGSVK